MSTATLDVNEAFAAERASQIQAIYDRRANAIEAAEKIRADFDQRLADGKVKDLGNGRYEVTDPGSWDNGEIWTMRTPAGLDQPLVLPESNLDMSKGRAALYTRRPEWHSLGTIVPEGVSDLDEVLRLSGGDYTVAQRPARFALVERDGVENPHTKIVPGQFVNFRTDNGAPFGVVGKVYSPIQNYDAARFLQDLIERYGIVFESAGATYGGAHFFVGMKLPEDIELNLPGGVVDVIKTYLYFVNTHDGSGKARVTLSPWRIACGNTERFNLRDANASWGVRHTTNALSDANVKEAQRTLGLAQTYYDKFKVEEESLARTDLAIAEFRELVKEVYPEPDKDATDRVRRTWDNVAPKRAVGTALAAARATAVIEGDADSDKNKVHARLLTLANR